MKNKRLRGGVQNVCLILLTLSALFLLARLPMLREIRLPGQVPALFSPEASPGGQEEAVLPAAMFPSMNLMVTGDSQYGRHGRLCVSADDASLQQITPQFGEALGSASTAERVSLSSPSPKQSPGRPIRRPRMSPVSPASRWP